ncbi:AraC family transcriptional regulator [Streptomyces sp. NPDC059002]|uniref:AraC family transcriptional regulator n=1 Tax=Streptomyces sp. NPDC059002 TaxID=3346690 RepID=UPI0036C9C089
MNPSPIAAHLPLAHFARLHTQDVDQARHVVADAFCPHRLTPLDRAREFETRFHSVRTSEVSLCYLDYGGSVHIAPEAQEEFYLVLIPLAGRAELGHGREQAHYDCTAASVPPVDRGYTIRVDAGSPHLVVWIARDRLEERLRLMLADSVRAPVRFALRMDMTVPAVRSWRNVVDLLLHELDGASGSGGPPPDPPLAMPDLERLLLGRLLLAQPNNYSARLHEQPRSTTPKVIRHAVELIEDHAAERLGVEDVAVALGISVRALQEGFRRFKDHTPSGYLREVRLRRAREELALADPTATSVTTVARNWCFDHPGRFAAMYRERFGELPSVTLKH